MTAAGRVPPPAPAGMDAGPQRCLSGGMGPETAGRSRHRPRRRNARATTLLWTAVAGIAAADALLDRLAF
ncbi:hypothetical protein GCM10009834_50040 [Streptomonospora arabica]